MEIMCFFCDIFTSIYITLVYSLLNRKLKVIIDFPEDKSQSQCHVEISAKSTPSDLMDELKKKYDLSITTFVFEGTVLDRETPFSKSSKKLFISPIKTIAAYSRSKTVSITDMKVSQADKLICQNITPSEKNELLTLIRQSIIGHDYVIETPFGVRRITYCDYVASGRALSFIEDWIREVVLPMYANTHTDLSGTGSQVNCLREESRSIIHKCCGCSEEDEVIFCGSGATGAINALTRILGITVPDRIKQLVDLRSIIPESKIPVVFIGPYEHHSNELPWRESLVDVVPIQQNDDGMIDRQELESMLQKYQNRELIIGSFSAASNVTGILSEVTSITRLLKKYGAISCWDYAAAAPYIKVDMNPADDAKIDAIFISPHKFIGGPGCSGLLLVKKSLLISSRVPNTPGGGTVAWVSQREHHYLNSCLHEREEGGTPNIVGDIRTGMIFHLKSVVSPELIHEREDKFLQKALQVWKQNPNISILGNTSIPRLSTVSFLVRHGEHYVHQNFICVLLNDLFGIQARSGCACAGPYGQVNLRINNDDASTFGGVVNKYGYMGVKPGFCRINFNYFISEEEAEFVIQALTFVADHGWKFIPEYVFEPMSGKWSHRKNPKDVKKHLSDVTYTCGKNETHIRLADESHFPDYFNEAERLRESIESKYYGASSQPMDFKPEVLPNEFNQVRWFQLPIEILQEMQKGREYQEELMSISKCAAWHCNLIKCNTCTS